MKINLNPHLQKKIKLLKKLQKMKMIKFLINYKKINWILVMTLISVIPIYKNKEI